LAVGANRGTASQQSSRLILPRKPGTTFRVIRLERATTKKRNRISAMSDESDKTIVVNAAKLEGQWINDHSNKLRAEGTAEKNRRAIVQPINCPHQNQRPKI
jgi:hypothetical protein